MKLPDSNEIRQLRNMCIFEVNGIEVYMLSSDLAKIVKFLKKLASF